MAGHQGVYEGNRFVMDYDEKGTLRPLGRIKIGDNEVAPLSLLFAMDNYNNVISWSVVDAARFAYDLTGDVAGKGATGSGLFSATSLASLIFDKAAPEELAKLGETLSKLGAGDYLAAHLPIIMEVQNSGGLHQVMIPSGDEAVQRVTRECLTPNEAKADLASLAARTRDIGKP